MRAVVYERTGPAAEVLEERDIDTPRPGPGEVRIRVHASGVNPTDWKSRAGLTPRPIDGFQIPNQDGAGVIDEVGDGVDASRLGERVWVRLAAAGRRWGTAAEWTVVPAEHAAALPDGATFEMGASLGVPALTAHHCLFADGPIGGSSVMVAGGAGAVGHFAIELAKRGGATVVATASSEEKAEMARAAGADLVVDYRSSDAADRIKREVGRIDRFVEVALGPNLDLDLAVARPAATLVCYAATGDDPVLPVRRLMTANLILRFVLLYGVPAEELGRAAEDITAALAEGALTPLPYKEFSLSDTASAHDAVEGGFTGKVLVLPG